MGNNSSECAAGTVSSTIEPRRSIWFVLFLLAASGFLIVAGFAKIPEFVTAAFLADLDDVAYLGFASAAEVLIGIWLLANRRSWAAMVLGTVIFGVLSAASSIFLWRGLDCGCTGVIDLSTKLVVAADWLIFMSLAGCLIWSGTGVHSDSTCYFRPLAMGMIALVGFVSIHAMLIRFGIGADLGVPVVCMGDFSPSNDADSNPENQDSPLAVGTVKILNPTSFPVEILSINGVCGFRPSVDLAFTLQPGEHRRLPMIARSKGLYRYLVVTSSDRKLTKQTGRLRVDL